MTWAHGALLAKRKETVSVSMPVYSASAALEESGAPEESIRSKTSSAVEDAFVSITDKGVISSLYGWWSITILTACDSSSGFRKRPSLSQPLASTMTATSMSPRRAISASEAGAMISPSGSSHV